MRLFAVILSAIIAFGANVAAQPLDEDPTPAMGQYQQLVEEYEEDGGAAELAPRFLQLAKDHPNDAAAVAAIQWVLKRRRTKPEAIAALELLKQHIDNDKLDKLCHPISRVPAIAAERLLERLAQKSPHRQVKAAACYYWASRLETEAGVVAQLKRNPDISERLLQYYGKQYGEHLAKLTRAQLDRKLEQVYEQMQRSFAGVSIRDQDLGTVAENALYRIRNLSEGRVAPEIKGEDVLGTQFKLSDYRGKVVVLSFWGDW